MWFLIPPVAAALGYAYGAKNEANNTLATAQEKVGGGVNLTTLAGYAIAGGLLFYFGKKVIK